MNARLQGEAREKGWTQEHHTPLFPNGWLKKSKYSFDETQVREYVQDAESYCDRSQQILRLAAQLDIFFIFEIDQEGRHWISVPGTASIPKPRPDKRMPEIIEREGGARIVYVDPSSHCADMEKERQILRTAEERQQENNRNAEDVDPDGWVHISHGDTETAHTDKRSMFLRFLKLV